MSMIALAGGAMIYWLLRHRYDLHLHVPVRYTGRLLFQQAYDGGVAMAGRLSSRLENGSLQRYLAITVATMIGFGAWPFLQFGFAGGGATATPAMPLALVVWGAAIVAALGVVLFHHERVVAVILAGVVGLAVSIAFAYFSAPDLALTQLAVEVVTTLLMLVALSFLPQSTVVESSPRRKLRDAVLAVIAGAGVAGLSWAVLTRSHESIAWYFFQNSLPLGGGGNVVNLLLVDFRGFDTFGEITVLSMAAMGAWILMADLRAERSIVIRPSEPDGIMFMVAARLLLPFTVLVAVYLFLRGHNQPGGGFLAGLVVAIALIMQYMGEGLQQTLTRLRIDFRILLGSGLLLAGLTGLAGIIAGAPFLTSAVGHPHVPLLGEIPLASATAFDLGVFMAVLGTTLLTLTAIGQARRKPSPTGGAT